MNDSGFITIHRSLFQWASSLSDSDFRLAITCVAMANWKPGKWRTKSGMIDIPRGSFVTTVEKLGIELSVDATRAKIRSGLRRLVACEFISLSPEIGRRFTYITVCNYSLYQDKGSGVDHEVTIKSPSNDHEPTMNQPSDNHDLTTIEQGNKGTKEQGNKKPKFDFESVYSRYPKKQGGTKGIAKLVKTCQTAEDFELLRKSVMTMASNWHGRPIKFCPMFSTYVNQSLWRDEIQSSPSDSTPGGNAPKIKDLT